jgi:hypothetical protein
MAGIPVVGTGPIAFTTKEGAHLTIPLGALSVVNGSIAVGAVWPPYAAADAAGKAAVDTWLGYLLKQKELTAAAVAPPGPSFTLKAAHPGTSGDAITVKIIQVTGGDPKSETQIDAEVGVTNVYADLRPDTIAETLGTGPGTGTQPGLVYVKSIASPPTMPGNLVKTALGNPPSVKVMDASAAAESFTLEAPGDGGHPDTFDVTIDVNAAKTAFTLTVNWKKAKAAVKLSAFNAEFGYVVTCVSPPGGFATDPTPGTIKLSGGANPSTSAPTSATGVVASA